MARKLDRIRELTPEQNFPARKDDDIDAYEAAEAWNISKRAAEQRLMILVTRKKMTTHLVRDPKRLHPIRIFREL